MRILFVSNFYPPYELGGYEQWCEEVANRLKIRGHEVAILTSRYGVPNRSREKNTWISRSLYLETDISYYKPVDFFTIRQRYERINIKELRKAIDRFSPEIIMVWGMWNLTHSIPYWAEQWMPGRVTYYISNYWPIDIDPHTNYWALPTNKPFMKRFKEPLSSLVAKKLRQEGYPPELLFENAVCCSQYVRLTLIEAGKLPVHTKVLLGGTDPEPFLKHSRLSKGKGVSKNRSLRLLYFGRLIHDKGVHTAIEALGLLNGRQTSNAVHLTILGSGHPQYEKKLREMVQELGIDDKVEFIAQIPRNKIPELLGNFDVFLFTSIWPEPMARSVMEAMAAGLLVIGTEVGGQMEMLNDGINSLTFKAEDANGLADQIARVVMDNSLMFDLADAGQKMVVEKFTLERMVDEIEKFLMDILNNT